MQLRNRRVFAPPYLYCHPERSEAESKDLHLNLPVPFLLASRLCLTPLPHAFASRRHSEASAWLGPQGPRREPKNLSSRARFAAPISSWRISLRFVSGVILPHTTPARTSGHRRGCRTLRGLCEECAFASRLCLAPLPHPIKPEQVSFYQYFRISSIGN